MTPEDENHLTDEDDTTFFTEEWGDWDAPEDVNVWEPAEYEDEED